MKKKPFSIKYVCPYDHSHLKLKERLSYTCDSCKRQYPILDDIVNFLPDNLRDWATKKYGLKKIQNPPEKFSSFEWKPGFRGWSPSSFIKFLSLGFGEGRVTKRYKGSVLDVGCGDVAKGDVNTDIYIPTPLPKNFVLATAEMLPFKDNSFDVVRSAYVIEHNLYPTEMVKEHYRVSRKKVEIFTDNSDWLGVYAYRILNVGSIFHDEHYFKWSVEYFRNLLNRIKFRGRVEVFNTSPSILVKLLSTFGRLPRIGVIFYRDLYAEIYKK